MRKNMALMGALMGAALLGGSAGMPDLKFENGQSFSNYKYSPNDSKGSNRGKKTNKLRCSHNAKLRRRSR